MPSFVHPLVLLPQPWQTLVDLYFWLIIVPCAAWKVAYWLGITRRDPAGRPAGSWREARWISVAELRKRAAIAAAGRSSGSEAPCQPVQQPPSPPSPCRVLADSDNDPLQ